MPWTGFSSGWCASFSAWGEAFGFWLASFHSSPHTSPVPPRWRNNPPGVKTKRDSIHICFSFLSRSRSLALSLARGPSRSGSLPPCCFHSLTYGYFFFLFFFSLFIPAALKKIFFFLRIQFPNLLYLRRVCFLFCSVVFSSLSSDLTSSSSPEATERVRCEMRS